MGFLVAAYALIIAALVGYVLRLRLVERAIRGQLGRMERADSRGRSARRPENG